VGVKAGEMEVLEAATVLAQLGREITAVLQELI
jgi:hypothetical protein